MDYRKFLSSSATLVLPYFGGSRVAGYGRRFRLKQPGSPGWWQFRIEGRNATPEAPADPPDLSELPRVRGNLVGAWLFANGTNIERVELLPPEQPPSLTVASSRRWESGELVFESLEFESEAEEAARRALEDGRGIDEIKGVSAGLRCAFAFALLRKRGEALGIHVSPLESPARALEVASGGAQAADRMLLERAEERRRALDRQRLRHTVAYASRHAVLSSGTEHDALQRAEKALDRAGASLLGSRRLDPGLLEVTFRFLGERFISVVDARTLQVYDAGICLSGEDRLVNLGSLPSVIREAMDTDQLNITRH